MPLKILPVFIRIKAEIQAKRLFMALWGKLINLEK